MKLERPACLRKEVKGVLAKNYFTIAFNLIANHIDIFTRGDQSDWDMYPAYLYEAEEGYYLLDKDIHCKYYDKKLKFETFQRYVARLEVLRKLMDSVYKEMFRLQEIHAPDGEF